MSVLEIKNCRAKCIDRDNPAEVVLHEVEFDLKDSGDWGHKVVQVMATDPMDAINYIRKVYTL